MIEEEKPTDRPAGNWHCDGFPFTYPRCGVCNKFKRPLHYDWNLPNWVCEDCQPP